MSSSKEGLRRGLRTVPFPRMPPPLKPSLSLPPPVHPSPPGSSLHPFTFIKSSFVET